MPLWMLSFLEAAGTIHSSVTEAWPVGRMAARSGRRVQEGEGAPQVFRVDTNEQKEPKSHVTNVYKYIQALVNTAMSLQVP